MPRRLPIRLVVLLLVAAVCRCSVCAQEEDYKFDLGAGVGVAGYLGDLNESNPLKSPGFSGELLFSYRPDARWIIRTVLGVSSLSGSSDNLKGALPSNETYSFKSSVYDLSERVEFNFFSYGIGETYKKMRRWTPYLTVGLGVSLAKCAGITSAALSLPLGAGIRYKVAKRCNLALEFVMTKAFGDRLDGEISDLYQIKSSFVKNTDWYSRLALTFTYEFGLRCRTCHYYD